MLAALKPFYEINFWKWSDRDKKAEFYEKNTTVILDFSNPGLNSTSPSQADSLPITTRGLLASSIIFSYSVHFQRKFIGIIWLWFSRYVVSDFSYMDCRGQTLSPHLLELTHVLVYVRLSDAVEPPCSYPDLPIRGNIWRFASVFILIWVFTVFSGSVLILLSTVKLLC